MAYSWATLRELSLSIMPKVYTPRFSALVGCQKILFYLKLQMLLELVLMTSPNPFGSLFSELGGYSGELGTRLSIVLYSAGLCKSAKLGVGVETGLICRHCGGVTCSNMVTFTGSGAGDVQADLSAIKSAVNIKITKNSLWFVCNDRRRDKVSSETIDLSRGKTIFTVFF